MSDEFRSILEKNPYLKTTMQDQFIPKMRYTYTYTSPARFRNPIMWESTFSESANILSSAYAVFGKKWTEKNKTLIRNPYAQFLKLESDFTKTWRVGEKSDFVAHLNAGVIWSYGNSSEAPYSEQFYVGGANSIRAFTVRSIGPGRYHTDVAGASYLEQTGDIKFVANLEYRPHFFGSLYGAVFVDAGNVWAMRNDGYRGETSVFKTTSLVKDMALATGIGLRYDLDFFVIRIDWGIGLHMPYDTGKSGFFNIRSFKDVQSLHLAVGYPF
jgi:hemolysin activation/secretion protein